MTGEIRDAKLLYNVLENNQIVEKSIDTYAEEADVFANEFYLSYQSGISVQKAFKVNQYDFEETKHLEPNTQKTKYASGILYDGAKYEIVRYQTMKNDKILLICR